MSFIHFDKTRNHLFFFYLDKQPLIFCQFDKTTVCSTKTKQSDEKFTAEDRSDNVQQVPRHPVPMDPRRRPRALRWQATPHLPPVDPHHLAGALRVPPLLSRLPPLLAASLYLMTASTLTTLSQQAVRRALRNILTEGSGSKPSRRLVGKA